MPNTRIPTRSHSAMNSLSFRKPYMRKRASIWPNASCSMYGSEIEPPPSAAHTSVVVRYSRSCSTIRSRPAAERRPHERGGSVLAELLDHPQPPRGQARVIVVLAREPRVEVDPSLH